MMAPVSANDDRLDAERSDESPASATSSRAAVAYAIHDAKNVLAALLANVGYLKDTVRIGPDNADVGEVLADIDECCTRLGSLLRESLMASRGAVQTVLRSDVRIRHLVLEAAEIVRLRALQGGVRVEIEHGDDGLVSVDRGLVLRLLENLLDNAIRYAGTHGTVRVAYETNATELVITVADDGPGFATNREASGVFTTTREILHGREGALNVGLGLSFCRAVVHAHGGELVATELPDSGAMFLARFPSVDAGEDERPLAPFSEPKIRPARR